jgi:hypothetical protein
MAHPGYIREYLGRSVQPEDLGLSDRIEIVRAVIRRTLPEFLERMTPQTVRPSVEQLQGDDPPPLALYQGPLAIFVWWGALESFRRRRRLLPFLLVAWVATVSASLLLTNRVDAHRLCVLVVPFTAWAALGLESFDRVWAEMGMPRVLRVSFFCLVAALGGARVFQMLTLLETHLPPVAAALRPVIEGSRGDIVMAVEGDSRSVGWVNLLILNRGQGWSRPSVFLPDSIRLPLFSAEGPDEDTLNALAEIAARSSVVLGPPGHVDILRKALVKHGFRVQDAGTAVVPLQVISAGTPIPRAPEIETRVP